MKVIELEEGKVYARKDSNCIYRMKNNELEIFSKSNSRGWESSCISYNDAMKDIFTETIDPFRIPNESTPIDTKVLCWDREGSKCKRYFSGIQNGRFTAFNGGTTSWSVVEKNNVIWDNMIIAEDE